MGSFRHAALLAVAAVACSFFASVAFARPKAKKGGGNAASFSYYLLSLSYAPDFCDQPTGNKDPRECGTGRQIGFVVHGLWPQSDAGRGPESCGPASPVSQQMVNLMLNYIPTPSLIQHEWATHGTCSALAVADYFAAVRKARDSIKIPVDLVHPAQAVQLAPADVTAKFAAANPLLPKEAFRVSCYQNGELQEVRICLDKNLAGRACTVSAGSCPAKSIRVLPVR